MKAVTRTTEELDHRDRTICSVDGCENPLHRTIYCNTHYLRVRRYGREHPIRREKGTGTIREDGYVILKKDGRQKYEHIWLAEQALGKPLPYGAEVHHVDGNPSNNNPANLVVCPDRQYHKLLHTRTKSKGRKK